MARYFMVAILVFSLGGCAADKMGGAAVEAGVLMSLGEDVAGQWRDESNYIPMEMPVAADTPYWATDHTLPARIYNLPEGPGEIKLPFQDLSIFDVTKISPTSKPPVSGGVTGNSYLIQLGALPSRESARREWMRIERRYPDLVRNQIHTIVPVELNPQIGTVFRLRTGLISEIKSARSLCRKFRSHGQDCFVVKSENPT